MKKISILLALFALAFTELVFASAVVTSSVGTVQVQTGTANARPLRTGDRVNQGDTVSTGAASSLVMKFDDGQVTALTSNSRLTVTAFQYNPTSQRGNVFLSLISGGMRAVTGLIGKNNPERVSIRAATATIGIRGSDISVMLVGGLVLLTVSDGVATFTVGNQTVTVSVGNAAFLGADGKVSQGTINQIAAQLQGTPAGQALLITLGGLTGLTNEINRAFPGIPPSGTPEDTGPTTGTSSTPSGPSGPTGGGGGGGTASPN